MMKSSELLVVVDSVEEAVKFYTEKLGFDLIDAQVSPDNSSQLQSAHVRKGKCFVTFKAPLIEELAEYSFIKRCSSRCTGLYMEMKKGLDRYHERCIKKGIKSATTPRVVDGVKSFVMRDPFGVKLIVAETPQHAAKPSLEFVGMKLNERDVLQKARSENDITNDMIAHLRTFGILRRASKKFAKLKLKQLTKKK